MFLPATRREMEKRGWHDLDVILVSGDAYIDSPFIGTAVIGRMLEAAGYRVGVIAQPDPSSGADITRLGEPRLFWGISGGSVDSLVANRTASGKRRRRDDYTPGGWNNRRPDRALLVYANLIRAHFRDTVPLVLGGIEASLRRIAHYDYWENRIRRSVLVDARADYLLYGMADYSVVALADRLAAGTSPFDLPGLCFLAHTPPGEGLLLPSFQEVRDDPRALTEMFMTFYRENDPVRGRILVQRQDSRHLVQNPPWPTLSTEELDRIHGLAYTRDLHPLDARQGRVRALETIRFAIPTHRGCYGECNFCAIAVHQGRTVSWRSTDSILAEARVLSRHPAFRGVISDLGGPTANMYGIECARKRTRGACPHRRCLYPRICPSLPIDHRPQMELLDRVRALPGVRRVFVASGLRYDMILADGKNGEAYLRRLLRHHVSGQLKVAPEHCEEHVLACMGKPGRESLLRFRKMFVRLCRETGQRLFLTYYIIAAHPGCRRKDMERLRRFALSRLKVLPRQVQIFTPTPSTISTLIYWTGRDPESGRLCFVERSFRGREDQKRVLRAASSGGAAGRSSGGRGSRANRSGRSRNRG